MSQRVYTPKKITMFRSLGFGMLDSTSGAWTTMNGTYLLFFLTMFAGLTPMQVGIIFLIAKLADSFICLAVGGISDNLYRTKIGRKFGRRHLPILIGAIMILVFYPSLFFIVKNNFLYYLVSYFLVDMANAIIGIAYETLPNEMTQDYIERTKLSSTRLFISAASTFTVTALPAFLLNILGNDSARAYTISGIALGIFFFIAILITYFSTWEFSPEQVQSFNQNETTKPKDSLKSVLHQYYKVLKTKVLRRFVVIYFMSYFAKDCYGAAFLYFIVSVLGLTEATGLSLLSLSFVGMFVVIAAGFIMAKKGPKLLWKISYSAILFVLACYGIIYLSNFNLSGVSYGIFILFILGILWQIGRQLLEFTPWNVFPFVPDVDTLVSTKKRAGIFASVQTFTRRLTGALGSMLIGVILEASGYIPGQIEQSTIVQHTIVFLFVGLPAILIIYCFYLIWNYNINKHTHQIVKDETARLQAGGLKSDVDPHVKAVVEDLSGYKYDDIWNPNN